MKKPKAGKAPEKKAAPPRIETKQVRHNFSESEVNELGRQLARTLGEARTIEAEFDQVKAGFKARETECAARIDLLQTGITNGFEMRTARCLVMLRPAEGKKDYYLADDKGEALGRKKSGALPNPVLTEDMLPADFQQSLPMDTGEDYPAGFERVEKIQFFTSAAGDHGSLEVGRKDGQWVSALNLKVGNTGLLETLGDADAAPFTVRYECLKGAVKRALVWLEENLDSETASGFEEQLWRPVRAQSGREE